LNTPQPAADAPGWAILCHRRSGASGLIALLSGVSGAPEVAAEPFSAAGPWQDVARTFHAGRPEEAREKLRAALRSGMCFRHSLDGESREFSRMLADELAAAGYRVVTLVRQLDTACAFSRIVADRLDIRGRAGLAGLRERLEEGATMPRWDARYVRTRVRELVEREAVFDADLSALAPHTFAIRFEALFRDGVDALRVLDELFRFLGLGQRSALLADHTALQALFFGEHHTHNLRARSSALEALWIQIADELTPLCPSSR